MSRYQFLFLEVISRKDDFHLERELVGCLLESLASNLRRDISEFEDDTTWLDWCSVHLDTTLSSSHRSLCGMSGIWFIRKYTDPEFSSLFEESDDRLTSTLDLTRSQVS
jgi:hypothetical protein